jgi:GTPase involved in cell partitioning and DNA repair
MLKNFLTIEHELAKYDQELEDKPRLLAINKMDLLSANERAAVSTKISTCKLEKTRTDPADSKLTEPNSGIFLLFRKSDEATASSASKVVVQGTAT